MHRLVALHGQPGWVASLTPLSVDGMIVAASATPLAESRAGRLVKRAGLADEFADMNPDEPTGTLIIPRPAV